MTFPLSTLTELVNYFSATDQAIDEASKQSNNASYISVYEMGRRIKKIPLETFVSFEHTSQPWTYPLIRSAWFALAFTQAKKEQQDSSVNIWFLKLPLDEQGKLIQVARDEYIAQFVELIEKKLDDPTILERVSSESPYGFKPSEEKLANINAMIKTELGLAVSPYFQMIKDYLKDHNNINKWEHLAYQGIADYCALLSQYEQNESAELEDILIAALPILPTSVLHAFSTCLEHHDLSVRLQTALSERANTDSEKDIMACLRAMSEEKNSGENSELSKALITNALQKGFQHKIELLSTISGRNWALLQDHKLMKLYLETLALNEDGQPTFTILLNDLLFIPGMREYVLKVLRDPDRSETLSKAIGLFYQDNAYS